MLVHPSEHAGAEGLGVDGLGDVRVHARREAPVDVHLQQQRQQQQQQQQQQCKW